MQDELGAAKEWDPADAKTIMKSDGAGHHVFTGHLPKGNYDFKVAVGGSWDVNYGANGEANGKTSRCVCSRTMMSPSPMMMRRMP